MPKFRTQVLVICALLLVTVPAHICVARSSPHSAGAKAPTKPIETTRKAVPVNELQLVDRRIETLAAGSATSALGFGEYESVGRDTFQIMGNVTIF
jgi:hypothetical protein